MIETLLKCYLSLVLEAIFKELKKRKKKKKPKEAL